ncbi:hypothetical protein RFI_15334, partial [Reticulomyxa filosa]
GGLSEIGEMETNFLSYASSTPSQGAGDNNNNNNNNSNNSNMESVPHHIDCEPLNEKKEVVKEREQEKAVTLVNFDLNNRTDVRDIQDEFLLMSSSSSSSSLSSSILSSSSSSASELPSSSPLL